MSMNNKECQYKELKDKMMVDHFKNICEQHMIHLQLQVMTNQQKLSKILMKFADSSEEEKAALTKEGFWYKHLIGDYITMIKEAREALG
jgi:hypothetical protein